MTAFDPKSIIDIAAEAEASPASEAELRGGVPMAPYMPPRRSAGLAPIEVRKGELDLTVNDAETALIAAGMPVFTRDKLLVRPAYRKMKAKNGKEILVPGLIEMSLATTVEWLNYTVPWEKYDGRSQGLVPIDPPDAVARALLSRQGLWRFQPLISAINTPTIRPDGSIFATPGYDPATSLFLFEDPNLRLRVKEHPTREDALAAVKVLRDLLVGFPFVAEVDFAVVLALIISSVSRGAISVTPLTVTRASTPGSGKSFIFDVAAMIAMAQLCPVISIGKKEEEFEKRLHGMLLDGSPFFSIDNVNGELGGDLLCQAVERPVIKVRPLGTSEMMHIESRSTIGASGNNLIVVGDMTRRTLQSNLDACMENPQDRKFAFNPVLQVLEDRGLYVSACLTIVRAYIMAGRPGKLTPLGSYEEWSDNVRSALVWLGLPDPCKSMEAARDEDPVLSSVRAVVNAWKAELFETQPYKTRELIEEAEKRIRDDGEDDYHLAHPLLNESLMQIGSRNGKLDLEVLGRWFRSNKGRIIGNVSIVNIAKGDKPAQWRLMPAQKQQAIEEIR